LPALSIQPAAEKSLTLLNAARYNRLKLFILATAGRGLALNRPGTNKVGPSFNSQL